jgi:hypothetical protein
MLSEERKSQVVYENFARVDEQKNDLLQKFVASLFPTTPAAPGRYYIKTEKNECNVITVTNGFRGVTPLLHKIWTGGSQYEPCSVEGGARAIRADASRAGHAHAAVGGPVNSMTGVAASLGQPAAANAFLAVARQPGVYQTSPPLLQQPCCPVVQQLWSLMLQQVW